MENRHQNIEKICAWSFLCAFAHTVKCDVNRILKGVNVDLDGLGCGRFFLCRMNRR